MRVAILAVVIMLVTHAALGAVLVPVVLLSWLLTRALVRSA
jgi:hypothetical protein